MKNILRYINLGSIEPNLMCALWEYPRIIIPESPIVFSFTPNKQMLLITNLYKLEKYLHVNELPPSIEKMRVYKSDNPTGTGLCDAESILIFIFCYPKINKEQELRKAVMATKVKILRKYGIETRSLGNDLFFEKDGRFKKFAGFTEQFFGNWTTSGSFITFDFNLELSKKVFNLDTEKFSTKGVKDIGDVVGGIHEINPSITFDIAPEIAQTLANRFDLEFKEDALTPEENSKIQVLTNRLNTDDWKLYGRHPDIK